MQFSHSFSALLVSLFFAVSAPSIVDAIPTGLVRDSDFLLSGSETHNLTERAPKSIRLVLKAIAIDGIEVLYTTAINIGSKGKSFNMIPSTGAIATWVLSENANGINGRNGIGPESSTTFKDTKQPFGKKYSRQGDSLEGTLATDNVEVGGTTLPDFKFGVANTLKGKMLQGKTYDGVMGFTRSTPSVVEPTIVEALANAGAISAAVSSWAFSRIAHPGDIGEILLGDVNTQLFDGKEAVTMKNVHRPGKPDDGRFRVAFSSVTVGTTAVEQISGTGVIDTASSMIVVPAADFVKIQAQFPGAVSIADGEPAQFAIPCTNTQGLTLNIGGQQWTIPGPEFVTFPIPAAGQGMCRTVIAGKKSLTEWSIGFTFWKQVYLSLDATKDTVMIAPLFSLIGLAS